MPELPEVETVVRSLRPFVVGKSITKVEVLQPKCFPDAKLSGHYLHSPIISIKRRAKMIDLQLENDWRILTHLKMTGQLLYKGKHQLAGGGHPTSDFLAQLPGKHTRVILTLTDGDQLFYNDLRMFGWLRVLTAQELAQVYAAYGPDANTKISVDYLASKFARRQQPIKQVIMDNTVWAGIGNIYAAETLFAAGINPHRPAKTLTRTEIATLINQTQIILADAIKHRGTTFDGRYVDAQGQQGNYVEKLQVYGRGGQKCYRCGCQLVSEKIGGRSTVWCESCQQ